MTATYLHKGQGKSDNAYHAQSSGRWPLTRAVKIIAEEIKPFYKIPQRIIRQWLEMIGACEWHHVGKYATECDYYDTEPILDALFGVDDGWWGTRIYTEEPVHHGNNSFLDEYEN